MRVLSYKNTRILTSSALTIRIPNELEKTVKVERIRVPKKIVDLTRIKHETITIKTKDGRSVFLLKSTPVIFKKNQQGEIEMGESLQINDEIEKNMVTRKGLLDDNGALKRKRFNEPEKIIVMQKGLQEENSEIKNVIIQKENVEPRMSVGVQQDETKTLIVVQEELQEEYSEMKKVMFIQKGNVGFSTQKEDNETNILTRKGLYRENQKQIFVQDELQGENNRVINLQKASHKGDVQIKQLITLQKDPQENNEARNVISYQLPEEHIVNEKLINAQEESLNNKIVIRPQKELQKGIIQIKQLITLQRKQEEDSNENKHLIWIENDIHDENLQTRKLLTLEGEPQEDNKSMITQTNLESRIARSPQNKLQTKKPMTNQKKLEGSVIQTTKSIGLQDENIETKHGLTTITLQKVLQNKSDETRKVATIHNISDENDDSKYMITLQRELEPEKLTIQDESGEYNDTKNVITIENAKDETFENCDTKNVFTVENNFEGNESKHLIIVQNLVDKSVGSNESKKVITLQNVHENSETKNLIIVQNFVDKNFEYNERKKGNIFYSTLDENIEHHDTKNLIIVQNDETSKGDPSCIIENNDSKNMIIVQNCVDKYLENEQMTSQNTLEEDNESKGLINLEELANGTQKLIPLQKNPSKTNLICEICGRKFPNQTKYETHLKQMHSDKSLKCPTCGKLLKTPSNLQKHLKIHKGLKFTCKLCGLSLSSKYALDTHTRRHNGDYTHKCTDCGKEYFNSKAFNHHVQAEHAGIRYPCEICGSILRSRRYYRDHMANHSNKDARTFECKVCGKYYSTKSALNEHSRIHSGQRYVCHICGKKSIQKGAHDGHMKTHSGEKTFICELCGKDFLRKDVLDQHMRKIHESVKISCGKCGKYFRSEHLLMVHRHTHDDVEKPYPCLLCEEKFIDKNFLRNHVNCVHIESKDDKIRKSEKKITMSKLEKTYPCLLCGANFDSNISLRHHKETAHLKLATYSCEQCKINFVNQDEFTAHMSNQHAHFSFSRVEENFVDAKDGRSAHAGDLVSSSIAQDFFVGSQRQSQAHASVSPRVSKSRAQESCHMSKYYAQVGHVGSHMSKSHAQKNFSRSHIRKTPAQENFATSYMSNSCAQEDVLSSHMSHSRAQEIADFDTSKSYAQENFISESRALAIVNAHTSNSHAQDYITNPLASNSHAQDDFVNPQVNIAREIEGFVNSDEEYLRDFEYQKTVTESEDVAPYANHEVVVEEFIDLVQI